MLPTFARSGSFRFGDLGAWQVTTDFTTLHQDNIEWWAGRLGFEPRELLDTIFAHELDHRAAFTSPPVRTIFQLNARNCSALFSTPAGASDLSVKRTIYLNAIAARRIQQDLEPLLEALTIFNAESSAFEKHRRITDSFKDAFLHGEARPIYAALAGIAERSGKNALPIIAGHLSLFPDAPLRADACKHALPLECSVQQGFWETVSALEALDEKRGLEALPEVQALPERRPPMTPAVASVVQDSTDRIVLRLSQITGRRYRTPGTEAKNEPQELAFMWRRHSIEEASARGALTNPFLSGRASAAVAVFRTSPMRCEGFRLRDDLDDRERSVFGRYFVNTQLVTQLLDKEVIECAFGKYGVCGESCVRPCANAGSAAQQLRARFERGGKIEEEDIWDSLNQAE